MDLDEHVFASAPFGQYFAGRRRRPHRDWFWDWFWARLYEQVLGPYSRPEAIRDCIEESVEASDAMAGAVPVADEAGANVAAGEESAESIKKVRAWLSKIAKHAR